MPRPSIEFMNARRALKPASGGAMQDWSTRQAPDSDIDPIERTEFETASRCADMLLAVDAMRFRLFAQFGLELAETVDEIPF